jgi:N-acetylmuramoyl-L-alanine amidase
VAIRNFKTRERTDYLVIHCTGTDDDIGAADIRRQHIAKGYLDLGFHFVIRRNGLVETGRVVTAPGVFDKDSVSICCVGSDEITTEQALSLRTLILELMEEYPNATVNPKCTFVNFSFDHLSVR